MRERMHRCAAVRNETMNESVCRSRRQVLEKGKNSRHKVGMKSHQVDGPTELRLKREVSNEHVPTREGRRKRRRKHDPNGEGKHINSQQLYR